MQENSGEKSCMVRIFVHLMGKRKLIKKANSHKRKKGNATTRNDQADEDEDENQSVR